MKKFFDLTTLLIVVGICALAYMSYNNFYLKKGVNEKNNKESGINEERAPKIVKVDPKTIGKRGEDVFSPSTGSVPLTDGEVTLVNNEIKIIENQENEKDPVNPPIKEDPAFSPSEKTPEPPPTDAQIQEPTTLPLPILPPVEEDRTPHDPSIPEDKLIPEEVEDTPEEIEEPSTPGFYENTTYSYNISYPTNWPIKIRREENISIGTIPPRDGQGAITIEIASDMSNEIEEAKAEAQRYPGIISIKEMPIIIDGTSGTKMTLYNSTNKLTDVYIYLEKFGYYYAIKYSEESPAFTTLVEEALSSFSFTK